MSASKISPELVRLNGVRHAEEIKVMIIGYMDALLPERMRCEVRIDPEEEGTIVLDGTPFTIESAEVAVKTFASIDHRIGWDLQEWRILRNYPHAPDDVDMNVVASEIAPRRIARAAVKAVWKLHAAGLFEREEESMMIFDDEPEF
jgi:hypothetical protein